MLAFVYFAALLIPLLLTIAGIAFTRGRTRPAVPGGNRRDYFGDRVAPAATAPRANGDRPFSPAQVLRLDRATKSCPDCAENVARATAVCPFCEHRFSVARTG